MRFVCWNVEKRDLVAWTLDSPLLGKVDVALFQEYNSAFKTAVPGYEKFEAISFETYGTAVFSQRKAVEVKSVKCPHGDYRLQIWKGLVYKATAVATFEDGLTVVSFHGFNGTLQGRDSAMLVDHLKAVSDVLPPTGPCVFAGDFNTFTEDHHEAVNAFMTKLGFQRAIAIPYNENKTLDLVFTRSCKTTLVATGHNESDHPYLAFDVEL